MGYIYIYVQNSYARSVEIQIIMIWEILQHEERSQQTTTKHKQTNKNNIRYQTNKQTSKKPKKTNKKQQQKTHVYPDTREFFVVVFCLFFVVFCLFVCLFDILCCFCLFATMQYKNAQFERILLELLGYKQTNQQQQTARRTHVIQYCVNNLSEQFCFILLTLLTVNTVHTVIA